MRTALSSPSLTSAVLLERRTAGGGDEGAGEGGGACSGNLRPTERSRYFTHVCTAARRTYAGLQLRSAMDANQRICVSWHGVSVSPP